MSSSTRLKQCFLRVYPANFQSLLELFEAEKLNQFLNALQTLLVKACPMLTNQNISGFKMFR